MTVAERPAIPAERFEARLAAAGRAADKAGFDALLIGVGADLRYLTGYNAHESERLTMLVVGRAAGSATLVVPLLERPAAEAGGRVDIPIATWTETQDPAEVVARLARGAGRLAVPRRRLGPPLVAPPAPPPGRAAGRVVRVGHDRAPDAPDDEGR